MTTVHDDRPHPIPPFAYLRYKENYFFLILDPDHQTFGACHLNNEPIFNRSRIALHLNVRGKQFHYINEMPIPNDFEGAERITDGKFSMRFAEPHKRFEMTCDAPEFSLDVVFEGRRPTFDYAYCGTAAPENPSFREVMTLGLNMPYNHHQQSLTSRGRITLKSGGSDATIEVNGLGYRDHSWSMRGDNIVKKHVWTGMNFPDRAIGMKTLETTVRPGLWAKEGYVSDKDGERALRKIDIVASGNKDGWPEKFRFNLRDVFDKPFTIDVDVAGRYGEVPLYSEKSVGGKPEYAIIETCCPLTIVETGEKGVGLIEIGKHPVFGGWS